MMFNATFNNMSFTWWWSVLLVEEFTDKTTDLPPVTDKLYQRKIPECGQVKED
jgi:hypothetical protein